MKRSGHVICVGIVLLVLGMGIPVQAATPQTDQGGWDNLKMISHGDWVKVVLKGAQSTQGRFEDFTADSIIIQAKAGEQSYKREDVVRVSTRGQRHRGRNTLIGVLVGAGAGLGIGAIVDARGGTKCGPSGPFLCGNLFPNLSKEGFTPIGAVVGGIVGLVLPTGKWREVYRAR